MDGGQLHLDQALDVARTGDLWLFRGASIADHAIRVTTNSPVNHVGMAVVLEDLPPLLWHAELGRSLTDVWSGKRQRGVQLHDMREAVTTWSQRYGQRPWLRQLEPVATPAMEDAVLGVIARMDGLPFPSTAALATRWLRGRAGRAGRAGSAGRAGGELSAPSTASAYCAEVVAATYTAMGLLDSQRPISWYDPGSFWSGDSLELLGGAALGAEIAISLGVR